MYGWKCNTVKHSNILADFWGLGMSKLIWLSCTSWQVKVRYLRTISKVRRLVKRQDIWQAYTDLNLTLDVSQSVTASWCCDALKLAVTQILKLAIILLLPAAMFCISPANQMSLKILIAELVKFGLCRWIQIKIYDGYHVPHGSYHMRGVYKQTHCGSRYNPINLPQTWGTRWSQYAQAEEFGSVPNRTWGRVSYLILLTFLLVSMFKDTNPQVNTAHTNTSQWNLLVYLKFWCSVSLWLCRLWVWLQLPEVHRNFSQDPSQWDQGAYNHSWLPFGCRLLDKTNLDNLMLVSLEGPMWTVSSVHGPGTNNAEIM